MLSKPNINMSFSYTYISYFIESDEGQSLVTASNVPSRSKMYVSYFTSILLSLNHDFELRSNLLHHLTSILNIHSLLRFSGQASAAEVVERRGFCYSVCILTNVVWNFNYPLIRTIPLSSKCICMFTILNLKGCYAETTAVYFQPMTNY